MSNIIDSIQLSGVTYTISGQSSGGSPTVELTQAEYDALVSAGTVSADTYYIITDSSIDYINSAQCQSQIDSSISGKADTSAVTEAIDAAVSGKVSTNDFNAYSGATDTLINSKASQSDLNSLSGTVTGHTANTAIHVTSSEKTTWSGKQDTLVSGTNIKTINNESLLGSGNIDIQGGGGKAIEAGRGISVTTGETADTVSFNLPIYSNSDSDIICGDESSHAFSGKHSNNFITGYGHFIKGGVIAAGKVSYNSFFGMDNTIQNARNTTQLNNSAVFGRTNYILNASYAFASGNGNQVNNDYEFASGRYNVSNTGSTDADRTLFSVGNGTADARHNAFEIRQNGDIYLTKDGQDVKLQDQLGGGGGGITSGEVQSMIDESISGKTDESAFTAHTADTTIHVTAQDKTNWNNKSDFSGSYNDLTNKLSAGTNVTIIDNVISAEGGGGVNVVQTTGTSTADVMSQDAVTTQLNNKANKSAAVGGYKFGSGSGNVYLQFTNVNSSNIGNKIYYPKINGKEIFTTNNIYAQKNYNFQLVETSAITTSVTSSSTDAQVPSAKAVYDIVGNIETLLSQI